MPVGVTIIEEDDDFANVMAAGSADAAVAADAADAVDAAAAVDAAVVDEQQRVAVPVQMA